MTLDGDRSPGLARTGLTIGEVAADAGVAVSAVRFYERHGLLTSVRTSTNQRRFGAEAACRIRIARVSQRVGLTLREVTAILDEAVPDGADEWEHLVERLVAEGRARIAMLQDTLTELTSDQRVCTLAPAALPRPLPLVSG